MANYIFALGDFVLGYKALKGKRIKAEKQLFAAIHRTYSGEDEWIVAS